MVRVLTFYAGAAPAFGGALTRRDGSDLLTLRLPLAHKPAVPFVASPALGSDTGLARSRFLPGSCAHFVPPFGVFRLADLLAETARVARPVLAHSSNQKPSG